MTFIPDRNIEIRRSTDLPDNAEISSHLGVVVSLWSEMETRLAEVFGVIAGMDSVIAMKIFTAIENEGSRKAVFMKLAEERLPQNLKEELLDIFRAIKESSKSRNKVAHGIWGVSPQVNDAIFYTDVRDWLVWQSHVHSAESRGEAIEVMEALRRWPSALGFRKSDFYTMEQEILKLIERIKSFRKSLIGHRPISPT